MTYPPQSPEPNQYGAAPGPGAPGPQPGGPDLLTEWGAKAHPGRPPKINQLTQVLWGYVALSVLMVPLAILAMATAPWWAATGFLVASAIVGVIFHGGVAGTIAWFITKGKLGAFGAQDPRVGLYIGYGLLGLFSLGGLWVGWGWIAAVGALVSLARLGAVGFSFYLLTQPEVEHWLRAQPGNQPKAPQVPPGGYQQQPGAQGYPQQPPAQGYPQQPGQQPPAPGYPQQQPPAPGQQVPPPPGYPQQ
ncbi:hypothetical protein ACFQS3_06370 [Glycomyces mayteni]|uniref:Uncharacterized protein n=1 Tax=Glycomyces mayteni TaxID=543887 RepID=A0ABW2D3W7_9ACTN|nr:hypothetical protein GCM10025732_57100 [Glycomyces mayteni]